MRKGRRQPPLFEVLSSPERRRPGGATGSSGGGVGGTSGATGTTGPRAVEVKVPQPVPETLPLPKSQPSGRPTQTPNLDSPSRSHSGQPRLRGLNLSWPAVWLGLAVLIALIAGVWYFAVRRAEDQKLQELANRSKIAPPAELAAPPSPTPSTNDLPTELPPTKPTLENPNPGIASIPAPPAPAPKPTPEPVSLDVDPRKVDTNYLMLGTLNWKDAEQAIAYLAKNGVKTAAVPARPVDPKVARDKNLPHLVFVLEGIPSDRYTAASRERTQLVQRVREIGRRFQKEERGASDFAEPYWKKFKGE